MTEALGDELTDAHSTVASYGGVGQSSMPMHHGHGGKKDEVQIDMSGIGQYAKLRGAFVAA